MPAFPALVGHKPRLLILGSMPGQVSLDQARYYAHPRNAFWWIMSQCFDFACSLSYIDRVSKLKSSGVAVWDVLHDCQRKGSLDNNIVRQSEVSNDFATFFRQHNTIIRTLFNGAAAEAIFRRHWVNLIDENPQIEWLRMPSTSPAHASLTREQKTIIWRNALRD